MPEKIVRKGKEFFLFAGEYLSFSKVGFIQKLDASCESPAGMTIVAG